MDTFARTSRTSACLLIFAAFGDPEAHTLDRVLLTIALALCAAIGVIATRLLRALARAETERDALARRMDERARALAGEVADRTLQLESLLAYAPVGLGFFDGDARYLRVNARLAEIHGLPMDAYAGRPLRELLPMIAITLEPKLRRVFQTGEAMRDVEITGETPARPGEVRHWLTSIYPVRDAQGAIVSVGSVVLEITERKRAEEAMRESEGRFRALFDADVVPFIFWHADGRILDANGAFLRLIASNRGELERGELRWDELTPPEWASADARIRTQIATSCRFAPVEKEYVRRDGTRVPVVVAGSAMPGGVEQGIAFVVDLSEQKRAEAALGEQLRLNRTITENAAAALFMLDERGRCTFMNPAAEAMTGFSMREVKDRLLHEVVHHHHEDGSPYPSDACPIVRALLGRNELREHEDVFLRRSGEPFPIVCSASPVFGDGGATCTVLEVRDVTEEKRIERERELLLESERTARAEAERASRLKDEFVSSMSHELRTPLNAILGWAQLLRRAPPTGDKLARGLEIIERNTRIQIQLVSDLLDVSRIVSGKLRLDMSPVDLPPLVEGALDGQRAAADAKGVTLAATIPTLTAPVRGDAARLSQIVSNLVSNAIKFTAPGGRVEVELERSGDHAALSVVDTGQGIAPEFLPCVFDRFRQADSSVSRRHGGLGLGLAIVKHLVDLHDGRVRAESEGVGKGSRFVVEIPIHADARPHVPATVSCAAPWEAPCLRGVRVLVVDDEPDARDVVRHLLEECEASVVTVACASEAIEALGAEVPDVLVSDIGLPGIDGYELIRRIRTDLPAPCRHLPAVALTAFVRPEDRERAMRAGFHAHLTKPVEPGELASMIATLCAPARESDRAVAS